MNRTSLGIYSTFLVFIAAFWLLSAKGKTLQSVPQENLRAREVNPQPFEDPKATMVDEAEIRRMIFLLQYIGNDYGRAVHLGLVIDTLEFNEMQHFSQTLLQTYRVTNKSSASIRHGLEQLAQQVTAKAEGTTIRNLSTQLVGLMTQDQGILIFPLATPDLSLGKQLFQENCVSCHGERGAGNGPAADTLNPKPRDLAAPAYLDFITPFHLYQAITLGVSGTAMPSFGEAFSSEQSWSLAFYVMTLRHGFNPYGAPKINPNLSLQQLAVQTNVELQRSLARDAMARTLSAEEVSRTIDYYRSHLPKLSLTEHIKITKTKWQQSLAYYQRADSAQALACLVDGYMLGFEPIEAMLANKVYLRVERLVTEYRWCIEEKGAFEKAEAYIKEMLALLEETLKNPRMLRS